MDYLSRQRSPLGGWAAQSALHKGGNAAYIKRGFPENPAESGMFVCGLPA
jgi:hypothetical protein